MSEENCQAGDGLFTCGYMFVALQNTHPTVFKSDLQIKKEWAYREKTPFAQQELYLFQLKLDLAPYQWQGFVAEMVLNRKAQG